VSGRKSATTRRGTLLLCTTPRFSLSLCDLSWFPRISFAIELYSIVCNKNELGGRTPARFIYLALRLSNSHTAYFLTKATHVCGEWQIVKGKRQPKARYGHSLLPHPAGKAFRSSDLQTTPFVGVILFGGSDGVMPLRFVVHIVIETRKQDEMMNDVQVFNREAKKWVKSSGSEDDEVPSSRRFHAAVILGSPSEEQKMVIVGGEGLDGCFNDVWVYGLGKFLPAAQQAQHINPLHPSH